MKFFKTLRKRGLALFLAFVMCIGFLPGQAMAADGDGVGDVIGSGTSTSTQSDANAYLVPGIPKRDDTDSTLFGFDQLYVRYKDEAQKECIKEQSIYFNGKIAADDAIYIAGTDGNPVETFTIGEQTWAVTTFAPAGEYDAQQTGIHLELTSSISPEQDVTAWNDALVGYLKGHLKAKLTNPEIDYQITFGSVSSGYAYNAANGHYYTYKMWEGANWSGANLTDDDANRTWENARTLAHAETFKGMTGHLLTITSAEEQAFVQNLFKGQFWTAGTRDPSLLGDKPISPEVQAINRATWGDTIVSRVENGVTKLSELTDNKSFCGWFWGDGPESERGLIYYPFSVNNTNTCPWITRSEFSDQKLGIVGDLNTTFNASNPIITWEYKDADGNGTGKYAYNNWHGAGTGGQEPNDCHDAYWSQEALDKLTVKLDPMPVAGDFRSDDAHEVCMHVYDYGNWNDYRSNNADVQGFLVEFEGESQDTTTVPAGNASANIIMSQYKDVVVLTENQPTYTPEIKKSDGTSVTNVKVDGKDPTDISTPGRYKVETSYTDGENSYFVDKTVTVIDLATKVTCDTAPTTHNIAATTAHLKDGTYTAAWNAEKNACVVTINKPGEYVNGYNPGEKTHTAKDSSIVVSVTFADGVMSAASLEQGTDGDLAGKYIVPIPAICTAELTNVEKTLVIGKAEDESQPNEELPEAVKAALGDLLVTYPASATSTITLGKDDKVTLLYKITVTGTEGANYTLTETEGAKFVNGEVTVTGKLENPNAEGICTATVYAYRTFGRDDIEQTNLVNKVELRAGDNTEVKTPDPDPENPDDPKQTGEKDIPAQRKPDVAKTAYPDENCTTPATSTSKGQTLYYQIAIDTNGSAADGKKTAVKSFKVEDAFVVADKDGKDQRIPFKPESLNVKVSGQSVEGSYSKETGIFVLKEAVTETIYVTYSYRIPYDSTFTNSSAVVNKAKVTVSTGDEPGPNDPSGESTSKVNLGYTITVQVVNGGSTLPEGIKWATNPVEKTEGGVPYTEGTISVKPGANLSVSFAPKTEEGHTYILDSVKMNGGDAKATYTPDEKGNFDYPFTDVRGNNTIRVEYALDDVGNPTDPDGKGPDGVPDKYQVKVTFLSKNGDLGPFKVKDAEGEFTASDLFAKATKFSSLTVYVNLYKENTETGEKELAVDGENKLTNSPLLRTITEEAQKKAQEDGTVIPTVGNHSNLGYTKPGNWVDSYTDDKGVTTTYGSNPNDQTVRYKADGYTYCYVYSPDKATVTVNYLDNDVDADGNHKVLHGPYSEEFTVAGYNVTDKTNVAIDHYIKDRVEIKSASGNAGLSVESGKFRPEPVVINVYYDLDNWHDGDKDPTDPTDHEDGGDGIPDKYQARIVYQVTDGKGKVFAMGQYLAERVMEIVTIGNNATSGTVDIAGARAVPNVGEEFNIWTAEDDMDVSWKPDGVNLEQMWLGESFSKLGVKIGVVGKHTYTFTAFFGASTTSYTVNFLDEEKNEDGTHNVLRSPKTRPNQTPGFKIDSIYEIVKIENYVFDHAEHDSIVLKKGSDNTINLYYAKDKIHETEEPVVPPIPDPDPDNIPDKYQVTIQYDTDGDGNVDLEEVRTLRDSEGNLIDAGAVTITGAKAAPGEGFAFDYWTAKAVSGHDGWVAPGLDGVGAEELCNIQINVKGGAVYLFTANVAEDKIHETEEPVVPPIPDPDPKPNPDDIPDKYQVTIRYDTNGDNVIDLEEVKTIVVDGKHAEIGDIIISGASADSVSGYHFTEWTASAEKDPTWGIQPQKDAQLGQLTISNAKGGEVYTFKANFAPNPSTPVTYYTVTYLDGGVPVGTQRDIAGRTVIVLPAPTAEGKTFTGWIGDDGRVYQPGDRIVLNSDKILTAQWEDNTPDTPVPETFTVTWIDPLNPDNPVIKTVEVEKLDDAEYPEHPAHEGWKGNGWSEPEQDADGNYIIRAEYVPLDVDPDAPSYEYLRDTLGIMVRVECRSNATHAPMTYEVPLKENSYEARVTGDTCTLTIAPDLYVAEFNRMSGGEHGTADVVSQRIELVYVPAEIVPVALDDEFAVDENVFVEDEEIANEVVTPVIDETEAPEEPAAGDVEAMEPVADDESVEGLPGDVEAAGYEVVSNAAAELGSWQLAEGYLDGQVIFYVHCEAPEVPDTIKVTFKDGLTDETIDERDVEEVPGPDEYPDAPTHDGYELDHWEIGEPDEDGNVTITAVYRPVDTPDPERTHTVTWVNWNGVQLEQRTNVPEGTDIPSSDFRGGTPARPSDGTYTYTFNGWSVSVDANGNVTYTAQYTPTLIYNPGTPSYPSYPSTPSTPSNPSTPSTNIPDTNPPLTDTPSGDGGTTITDQDVPLAGAVGLNDVDHFAYIIGYSDDTVRPLNNITRAEVATIFFRLMTDEYRTSNWATTNDFSDVAAGNWFNNAISTCANAGALNGYSDGSFRPNANITRAEFAAIAARFLDKEQYTDDGTGDFSDTAGHWAAKEIRLAAKAGWIQGSGNKFRPNDYITRAEVMTIVNRMLDRVPDKDHMLDTMKKWTDNPEDAWYYEAVQEATNEHAYERDELGVVETWTEILTVRDWKALEAEWASANAK